MSETYTISDRTLFIRKQRYDAMKAKQARLEAVDALYETSEHEGTLLGPGDRLKPKSSAAHYHDSGRQQ